MLRSLLLVVCGHAALAVPKPLQPKDTLAASSHAEAELAAHVSELLAKSKNPVLDIKRALALSDTTATTSFAVGDYQCTQTVTCVLPSPPPPSSPPPPPPPPTCTMGTKIEKATCAERQSAWGETTEASSDACAALCLADDACMSSSWKGGYVDGSGTSAYGLCRLCATAECTGINCGGSGWYNWDYVPKTCS